MNRLLTLIVLTLWDCPLMDQPLSSNEQTKVVLFFLLLLPTLGLAIGGFLIIAYGLFMLNKQADFTYLEIIKKLFTAYTKLIFVILILISASTAYSEYVKVRNTISENTKNLVEFTKEKEEIYAKVQANTEKEKELRKSLYFDMQRNADQYADSTNLELGRIPLLNQVIDNASHDLDDGYSTYTLEVLLPAFIIPFIPIIYLYLFTYLFYTPINNHKDWIIANGIFATELKEPISTPLISLPSFFIKKYSNLSVADELVKINKLKDDGLISQEEFDKLRKDLLG